MNIIHRKDFVKAKEAGEDVDALRAKLAAEYERTTVNANLSLEMGEIDAMIDPEQTRQAIAESLRLLADKKRVRRTTNITATSRCSPSRRGALRGTTDFEPIPAMAAPHNVQIKEGTPTHVRPQFLSQSAQRRTSCARFRRTVHTLAGCAR